MNGDPMNVELTERFVVLPLRDKLSLCGIGSASSSNKATTRVEVEEFRRVSTVASVHASERIVHRTSKRQHTILKYSFRVHFSFLTQVRSSAVTWNCKLHRGEIRAVQNLPEQIHQG